MSAYPADVTPNDPQAAWNRGSSLEIPESHCPICNAHMEQHAEIDPDTGDEYVEDGWYVHGSDIWLKTADCGADGRLYCSDSCRQQAAYQRMLPGQQDAMRTILRAVLDIDSARRTLRKEFDFGALNRAEVVTSDVNELFQGEDKVIYALRGLFAEAENVYRSVRGTADNEQPAWAIEVEQ